MCSSEQLILRSGTMQNSGSSPNYPGIVQDGSYKATIVVAPTSRPASYPLSVKQ